MEGRRQAGTAADAIRRIAAVMATEKRAVAACAAEFDLSDQWLGRLALLIPRGRPITREPVFAALFEGSRAAMLALEATRAAREGMLVPVHLRVETAEGDPRAIRSNACVPNGPLAWTLPPPTATPA